MFSIIEYLLLLLLISGISFARGITEELTSGALIQHTLTDDSILVPLT